MSSDLILRDDADVRYSYDRIQTRGYFTGHIQGLAQAAGWLRERAIELFTQGKDKEATDLRKMAEAMVAKLEPEMRRRSKEYEENYPEILDEE